MGPARKQTAAAQALGLPLQTPAHKIRVLGIEKLGDAPGRDRDAA
ncbi:MAG: hypothetical protein QM820_44680 [Minicystis sp.]